MADDLTGLQVVEKITETNKAFKDEVVLKAKTEVEAVKTELSGKIEAQKGEIETYKAKILTLETDMTEVKSIKGRSKFMNKGQAQASLEETVAEQIAVKKEMFLKMAGDNSYMGETMKMDYKVATVTSASLSGQVYGTYLDWRPGMEPTGQIHFRDIPGVRTIQSDTDTVFYPRANIPVGAGSFGRQASEGALKAQVDRGYTMITLTLTPIAGWLAASRQSLRNIPFLQSWLPTSLNEQLMDFEDVTFANTLVAAATGSTAGLTSPTTGINADNFIKLVKNLIASKYRPNAMAVDPSVWANFLTYKASGSGEYTLPIGTVNIGPRGDVYFLGIPVIPVNWLTGGRVIVGDWTKCAIVESEGLTLRTSDSATSQDFQKNLITFLLERVEDLAIFRTEAFTTTVLNAS